MNEIEQLQPEKVNPYLSVWLHPRKTTRYVIQNQGLFFAMIVVSIGFIGLLLSLLVESVIYPTLPIWGILLIILVLSPILGILLNSLFALGLWLFGKLFQGIGTYKEVFKSSALFNIPYIYVIPFYILWMLIEPDSLFYAYEEGKFYLPIFDKLLNGILTIWCFVISIPIVAEVHKVSYWKSFFSLLITSLLLIILLTPLFIVLSIFFIMFEPGFV